MTKHKRFPTPLIGLVLLLASPIVACGQPEGQPEQESPYTAEELRQIEERELFQPYQEMKGYIAHAHTVTLGLQNFGWHQFADVGWSELNEYGVKRWTLVSQVLPPAEAVKPLFLSEEPCELYSEVVSEVLPFAEALKQLLAQCDECNALATKVWSASPYKEPQTIVQEMEKLKIPEWQGLCDELQSALVEAERQALNLETGTEKLFTEIEDVFSNERPSVKARYLQKFQSRSAKYTDLLDEATWNLEQARHAASELRNWQFSSLSTGED